jgi:transposase
MKRSRQQVEVDLPELYAVLDQARHEPLSDPNYQKLKTALGALAGLATPERTTEKMGSVLAEINGTPSSEQKKSGSKPGHGRNGASAFSGADRRPIRHARLTSGDLCPECEKGKVWPRSGHCFAAL